MQTIFALVGTGSTLALVGVGLLEAAAVAGLHEGLGWPWWVCLLIVGGLSVAIGAAVFAASKTHVDQKVEENLTISGQAKQLPWATLGVSVIAGLALSRFVRWVARGSIVPTTAPPDPPHRVPVVTYDPQEREAEPPRPHQAAAAFDGRRPARRPPPRRPPEPPPRPLMGELGTALRGLGESALSSVLSLGARTLGEKLLEQVFDNGPPRATAATGHHDRRRNGSHPSPSL